jgi:AraC-like DNA-binding protein
MVQLAEGDGFAVDDLRIVERETSWSKPEQGMGFRLVFIRRGFFRLRLQEWEGLADPVTAYIGRPDDQQSIAHRPDGEDVCTVVTLDDHLAHDVLLEDPRRAPARPVSTDGRLDLAQRALVARARRGVDEFELAERVVRLAEEMVHRDLHGASPPSGHSTTPFRRRVVDSARELLASDPVSPGLGRLAQRLGVSRSYLSRWFRWETGETMTRFRNRLRVRAVLDRIEAGETDLARLAVELGFADHAHLTRTMRAEVGSPPSHVRRLLIGVVARG